MITDDGEHEGLRGRDGHGHASGRGARHARRDPPDRAPESVRLSRPAMALVLFVFLALLFWVNAVVLWLIAEVLPLWVAIPLASGLMFALCWFMTAGC